MNGRQFKKGTNKKFKDKKLILVFDENARREFLTGFRKRKLQRKTKAAEELEKKVKLERKRIKAETKMLYQRLVHSQKAVPEVSHLISEDIDMGEHCVSVTEISPSAAAKEYSWIGPNQVSYESTNDKEKHKKKEEDDSDDEVEGMEIVSKKKSAPEIDNMKLKTKKDFKKAIKKQATKNVKKSKVYKAKSKASQIKDKKKKRREELNRLIKAKKGNK